MTLDEETKQLNQLLDGKVVTAVYRQRPNEIVLDFSDGRRLIIDASSDLEISVTE